VNNNVVQICQAIRRPWDHNCQKKDAVLYADQTASGEVCRGIPPARAGFNNIRTQVMRANATFA
jgi:hypothetical protein